MAYDLVKMNETIRQLKYTTTIIQNEMVKKEHFKMKFDVIKDSLDKALNCCKENTERFQELKDTVNTNHSDLIGNKGIGYLKGQLKVIEKDMATKDDISNMATKDDLNQLTNEVNEKFEKLFQHLGIKN